MHKQQYSDGINVNWSDGEWERLQEIKEAHFTNPEWRPPKRKTKSTESHRISIDLSPLLISKVREYIGKHDISLSVMIRTVLEVITDDNT